MMARSGSVRRWLEELRYETESYDPQVQLQQPQEPGVSWRYARVTWSPESAVLATNQSVESVRNSDKNSEKHSEKSTKENKDTMPAIRVESLTHKVRDVVAKREEEIQSEEPDVTRKRLQTVSIAPGTVGIRRQNFSTGPNLHPPQSPDLILRRKQSTLAVSKPSRPLSHQTPKQTSFLHQSLPTIIKEGPMNKVKLMTGGTKSPKHWKTGMHAVLTDKAIFFTEDSDSILLMKSGAATNIPSERIVKLSDGARIFPDTDRTHSSKRNVLAISNKEGSIAVLIQNDEQQLSEGWFREISNVIAKHSDKSPPFGLAATNTKSKLNWFFKKRPNKEMLVNQGIYKNEPIFGNTLERLFDASDKKRPVPEFVMSCTEILENPPHVFSIGLYRTSGNLSHIQKLRLRVDQEDAKALEDLTIASDSDVLAGALKLFFRELQMPLVPYNIYLNLSDACTKRDNKEKFTYSRDALKKLSEPHYKTLGILCKHLLTITKYEKQNQMSSANLSIVWGPSFTWPDVGAGTRALDLCTDVNRVVQYLIEESNNLF